MRQNICLIYEQEDKRRYEVGQLTWLGNQNYLKQDPLCLQNNIKFSQNVDIRDVLVYLYSKNAKKIISHRDIIVFHYLY